jgi:hypothetical protein
MNKIQLMHNEFPCFSTINDNETLLLYRGITRIETTIIPFVHAKIKQTKVKKQKFFKKIPLWIMGYQLVKLKHNPTIILFPEMA